LAHPEASKKTRKAQIDVLQMLMATELY